MNKTIEITKVVAVGDTIQYEICDSTGLSLLKSRRVEAWVKFHHAVSLFLARLAGIHLGYPYLAVLITGYVVLWGGSGCPVHG